jgi:hypothetical protein
MCDYRVKSRPAKVGDKLTTTNFNTGTREVCRTGGFHNRGVHSSWNRACFFRGGEMHPIPP